MNIKKIIFKVILIILWLMIIFSFSNQTGEESSNLTNGILEKIFWFVNNDFFFLFIRKVAHFTEYFILSILVYNLIIEFKVNHRLVIVALFCALCACFDEFHQLFIVGREGSFLDVIIDIFGCISSIFVLKLLKKRI